MNKLLSCTKCNSKNCYIISYQRGQCRACGFVFGFRHEYAPDLETLTAGLKTATNGNTDFLNKLAENFFFYKEKTSEQKQAVYYNMYVFLKNGEAIPAGAVPVLTLPAETLAALLAGKITVVTRQTETKYRGIILLQQAAKSAKSKGKIIAAALLTGCAAIISSTLKSYAAEVEAGQKYYAPTDPEQLAYNDFTPGRYAYSISVFRELKKPVTYTDTVAGFAAFRGDYKKLKIKWNI